MDLFLDENVEDFYTQSDTMRYNPLPVEPQMQMQPEPDNNNMMLTEQITANTQEEKDTEPKNEFVVLGYDDDDNKENTQANETPKAETPQHNEALPTDLHLPIVDSLQPDELCLCVQDTITKMKALNPSTDAHIIMAYKANLVEQLEKLQNISAAIESLNNMQKTAENLPKNEKTGYSDIDAINLALREHCFFAEQISIFGMILCEICDIHKLREKYSNEYTDLLAKKMCESISCEFEYQHLLFHYNSKTLVILVYIKDEDELLLAGRSIVKVLSSHSFEVNDQILHSNIACGLAIYEKERRDAENPFDFRTWLKNAELGLNKAKNCGLKNQCAISKDDDLMRAIVPSMSNSGSGSASNHRKQNKSQLSLLARPRGASSGHSLGNLSSTNMKMAAINNQLTRRQIRASIRLYDKLSRLDSSKGDGYKLVALSVCRRMKESGANYNFQHPKYNGNTILMLCCEKNLEILIKYLCLKVCEEIDFSLKNTEGNNALLIAIGNKNVSDESVQLIVKKTPDKMVTNHAGKTAVLLAQEMGRNELIAVLQGI